MKGTSIAIFILLFLCLSCNESDDSINPNEGNEENEEETSTVPEYRRIIDLSSSGLSASAQLEDFDVEDGYLYFLYYNNIYRTDLSSETSTLEGIVEDTTDAADWIGTFRAIGNHLYYQDVMTWGSSDIKQINLDAISEGVQSTYAIMGTSRAQLGKNADKLYYVSSVNTFSPINNFYEFNPSDTDSLLVTDEYIFPENLRVVDDYLYFSSHKEIRRFDLNNSTEASSIVYTVTDTVDNNYIRGFDMLDSTVYYTLTYNTNIYYKDLEGEEELPKTFKTEEEESCKYGKLIISDGKLYVRKVNEKEIEVWDLGE